MKMKKKVSTFLVAAIITGFAVACTDESENALTSPDGTLGALEGIGTHPGPAGAPSPVPPSSAAAAALANGGLSVGVLAYCTDLGATDFGAQNTVNTLVADGRFGSVTLIDGDVIAPSAQDLLDDFDAVIAMTDNRCGATLSASDALAGFANGGGGVVLATFGYSTSIGFTAPIFAAGLSPFQQVQGGNAAAGAIDVAGASTTPPCDALMDGVSSPVSSDFANFVTLSAGATLCASYTNDRMLLAINAAGNVVGLNTFPADQTDNGQASYRNLIANAVFAVSGIVIQENGKTVAIVTVPDDAFDEPVIPKFEFKDGDCHEFLISQYGRCLLVEFRSRETGNLLTPDVDLAYAMCLPEDIPEAITNPLVIYEFDDATSPVTPLEDFPEDDLDCSEFDVVVAQPGNSLMRFARGLVDRVTQFFAPEPLVAAPAVFRADNGRRFFGLSSLFVWANPIVPQPTAGDFDTNGVIKCDKDNSTITVAVLTTIDVDVKKNFVATDINANTVRFGPTGGLAEAQEIHRNKNPDSAKRHEKDMNGDGETDMVFHFRYGDTGLTCQDTFARLDGETINGDRIVSADFVRLVEK